MTFVEGIGDEVVVVLSLTCVLFGVSLARVLHRSDAGAATEPTLPPTAAAVATMATPTTLSSADDGVAGTHQPPGNFLVTVRVVAAAPRADERVAVTERTTAGALKATLRRRWRFAVGDAATVRVVFAGRELDDAARLVSLGVDNNTVVHAIVRDAAAPAAAEATTNTPGAAPLPPLPSPEAIQLSVTMGGFLCCMFGLLGSRGWVIFGGPALWCMLFLSGGFYICGGVHVLLACALHARIRWIQGRRSVVVEEGRRRPHSD